MTYYYRLAVMPEDAEAIHRLNYRTFVEEIPQHSPDATGRLIDKFHGENTYMLCMKDGELAGMIALRAARPFSLDEKVGPVEVSLDDPPENPVEVRLLAVDPAHRSGRAFFGMLQALVNWCLREGYDAAVISGTVRELKLYRRLGFVPFAEPVGTEEARYVPMILTPATYADSPAQRLGRPMVNFLPGPVTLAENVRAALMQEPVSHRSPQYARRLASVQSYLKSLTGARYVQLLQGTGTLANDAVAAQLKRLGGRGLILVNGEFGRRLCDHAARNGLAFDCLTQDYGQPFCMEALSAQLDAGQYAWLWTVHCETSTGVLNPLEEIASLCRARGIRIAADCASSLGTVPVSLRNIDFASSVSGKGLAGCTGLAIVFYNEHLSPDTAIPRYLDVGSYEAAGGIPYTQSSNLLFALDAALVNLSEAADGHFEQVRLAARQMRTGAESLGFTVLAPEEATSPGVLTLVPPSGLSARALGDDLFLNGFRMHYESGYLAERNWLQAALMTVPDEADITRFLDVLQKLAAE
ncbi:acetyltransferase [Sporosarcina sp. NCCP-2716]|uniref:aminotransferase class V-fold PLP-dependent enzyme n=1 Tax=Sporosarcina sp. NCCP-2716 TaxID=2943679 RepID=UPI00203FA710|nr:aminotransferase class V-fold PLP-dependent enzyme [Sporosarcina sp. NCCP-2716]GKV70457.1 acetyltransferase [Sporosarcina sp. NCCP-2716]